MQKRKHAARRLIAISAIVLASLLVLNAGLGWLLPPKSSWQEVTAPSGRTYRIAYNKMTADGRHYFLAYDASGTDAWTQSEAVGELAEMIERDPRSGPLQTVGIVAQRHHGFGLLRFERSEGVVYERRGDRWIRATGAAIDEHLRAWGGVPIK